MTQPTIPEANPPRGKKRPREEPDDIIDTTSKPTKRKRYDAPQKRQKNEK